MPPRPTALVGRGAWLVGVSMALVVTGCGRGEAPATWGLADNDLDPSATGFTAVVTRIGCNSGVTGEVQPPTITTTDQEVTVTFTVTPGEPRAAGCAGNDLVPCRVDLPEALGRRELVDGACRTDEGRDNGECENGGVRFAR